MEEDTALDKRSIRVDALKEEYPLIVWGYQKTTPEDFIDFLFGADRYWRTWATGELLLHGSWKLVMGILGVEGVIERWNDVKKMYVRNKVTERMYLDIEWLVEYAGKRGKD